MGPWDDCDKTRLYLIARMDGVRKFMSAEDPPPYAAVGGYESVELDPADPFERVLRKVVLTNRKKRADYAKDGEIFSNFEDTAWLTRTGLPEWSALFNVAQKLSRLRSLEGNGRLERAVNESVADTYLDLAVYAVIALAIYTERVGSGGE